MLRGANMNLYLHLKWLSVECFQTAVFTANRAERYSAYIVTRQRCATHY